MASVPPNNPNNTATSNLTGNATSITTGTLSQGKSIQIVVGQTLLASVVKVNGNQTLLNIGSQIITARSPNQPLMTGQTLQLKVTQVTPTVQLAISSIQGQQVSASPEKIIQSVLAQILPNQTSVSQGLSELIQLTHTGKLPSAIQAFLFKLFDSLFKLSNRTKPEEFKAALLSSGLFLENRLAKNKKPTANDFKAQLLKLLQLTQKETTSSPELKSLSRTLQQLLNKITHQQIQAIQNPHTWQLQIPTSPNHPLRAFQLDIRKTSTQHSPTWETLITLDLDQLGTLVTKCVFQDETFSFQFWAEQSELKQNVENTLEGFRQQLISSGMAVRHLLISSQKPQVNPLATKIALIDIKV